MLGDAARRSLSSSPRPSWLRPLSLLAKKIAEDGSFFSRPCSSCLLASRRGQLLPSPGWAGTPSPAPSGQDGAAAEESSMGQAQALGQMSLGGPARPEVGPGTCCLGLGSRVEILSRACPPFQHPRIRHREGKMDGSHFQGAPNLRGEDTELLTAVDTQSGGGYRALCA